MSDSRLEFTRFEYQVAITNVSTRFLRFRKMFRTHVCGFVNPNIYNSSYWNGLCHGDYGISVMANLNTAVVIVHSLCVQNDDRGKLMERL